MKTPTRVVVVGAGVGGLVSAALLAAAGLDVQLVERAATPGGKLREVAIGEHRIDAGPTVFTMRWVFDELCAALGTRLEDHVALEPAQVLARHAWGPGETCDLHADLDASVAAIAAFSSPAEAERYRRFCDRAERIYRALEAPFLRSPRPSVASLVARAGWRGLPALAGISPFTTLWQALGEHFRDPRLQQLFGRYATYCGASPFEAPATLMLVAHVERVGVWLVDGGMHKLAQALAGLARGAGARLRYGATVERIDIAAGRAAGVRLADGERIAADAVVFNGDVQALATGLLGEPLRTAVPATREPSLSALTWSVVAGTGGFALSRHNVFFSTDYAREFRALTDERRLPDDPTVYVCAQDRDATGRATDTAVPERLFVLANAPAAGPDRALTPEEIDSCQQRVFQRLERSGLRLQPSMPPVTTTPQDFARLYPGTHGALYGPAGHGWQASFSRSGSTSRLPGLYLAGGSTHPGPGVPMAALSGRLAAERLLADRRLSTRRWPAAAMPGGTSTR